MSKEKSFQPSSKCLYRHVRWPQVVRQTVPHWGAADRKAAVTVACLRRLTAWPWNLFKVRSRSLKSTIFDRWHTSSYLSFKFYCKDDHILYRSRDKTRCWSKIAIFRRTLLSYVRLTAWAVRLSSVCDVRAPCAEGWTFRQYLCTT